MNLDRITGTIPDQLPGDGKLGAGAHVRYVGVGALASLSLLGLAAALEGNSDLNLDLVNQWQTAEAGDPHTDLGRDDLRFVDAMNVDDRAQIIDQGQQAQKRNSQIPFSAMPLEKVGTFSLGGFGEASKAAALKCMSQAVYYEAGFELLAGRRAVAQTVLNRVRHPAYPNSVCGVVYQGSERESGCQFSFTCNGALLRRPAGPAWREAEKIAKDALEGHVETSVGTATHYHADYVLPKWAFQLGKVRKLGAHIFYRFNGGLGNIRSFSSRYSGIERIPEINFAALRARLAADDAELAEQFVPGLTVPRHITDRHAENDVGGRIDVTKEWRLSIPDPTEASTHYRAAIAPSQDKGEAKAAANLATAENPLKIAVQ